jgi:ABC-type Fe3+ transport system permease subunit
VTPTRHVERAELEASLRDLLGEGEQTARQYAGVSIGVAGAASFLAIVFAFLIGRRKGRRRSAVIEIRRN